MGLQKRITLLLEAITQGMQEREEIIAASLLGALCGANTFLYGPPGTAKSLISRRLACAFAGPTYFEYLMNRFSTPEEVFGPISIKALKEDRYIRKTDKYLPKAEFGFLDEIWKASPAILNTLLTLINERIYRNGEEIQNAPLKALIAASNEIPEPGQGLEALYDRFILRLLVGPIVSQDAFETLLTSRPTEAAVTVDLALVIKPEEWDLWRAEMHAVTLSPECLTIIRLIRQALADQFETLQVYVSDRRWQRAALLMKASAYFNDRTATNHSDAVLLQHCLWTQDDNRDAVAKIVSEAIHQTGFSSDIGFPKIIKQKEDIDKEIHGALFHTSDIYETIKLKDENEYFELKLKNYHGRISSYYVRKHDFGNNDVDLFDENLNKIELIKIYFNKTATLSLKQQVHHRDELHLLNNKNSYTLPILFHKGNKKEDASPRLKKSLRDTVKDIQSQLEQALTQVRTSAEGYEAALTSPFITTAQRDLALVGIQDQINKLEQHILDCQRLETLCA